MRFILLKCTKDDPNCPHHPRFRWEKDKGAHLFLSFCESCDCYLDKDKKQCSKEQSMKDWALMGSVWDYCGRGPGNIAERMSKI